MFEPPDIRCSALIPDWGVIARIHRPPTHTHALPRTPVLILHYVEAHKYVPPAEFVAEVLLRSRHPRHRSAAHRRGSGDGEFSCPEKRTGLETWRGVDEVN